MSNLPILKLLTPSCVWQVPSERHNLIFPHNYKEDSETSFRLLPWTLVESESLMYQEVVVNFHSMSIDKMQWMLMPS